MQTIRHVTQDGPEMQDGLAVELCYTETMLRTAVRTFVWRRLLRRRWLWLAAAGLLLASLVLSGWANPSFAAGLAVAGLACLAALVAAVWRAHFVNTVGRYRAMNPPCARFTFGAASMTVASSLGASTLPWSSVVAVWEIDEAWMLFLAPNQFLTLPTTGLGPETRVFLQTRLPRASRA